MAIRRRRRQLLIILVDYDRLFYYEKNLQIKAIFLYWLLQPIHDFGLRDARHGAAAPAVVCSWEHHVYRSAAAAG